MDITLPPELESYVDELVAAGRYHTKAEVLTDAVHALRERRELSAAEVTELRRELQLGIDELERGEYDEWDDVKDLAEAIKKEGRALLESSRLARA
jgi:antitoxin ParD1/3/4